MHGVPIGRNKEGLFVPVFRRLPWLWRRRRWLPRRRWPPTTTSAHPLNVSAGHSLAGCTAGASADFASAYDGAEVEPQVAVNPLNPDEIIGAAQQDRWPDGGARGLTSWISDDGGASLVAAAGRAVERVPGRAGAVRAGDRPVGLLRRRRQRLLHRPADRLGRARAVRGFDHELRPRGRGVAPAADPDRGRRRPRRLQRQDLGHRRSDPPGLRVRDVAPRRLPQRRAPSPRTPTSTRSPTAGSRCSRARPTAG